MSEMISALKLTSAELEMVAQVLAAVIPEREVWAFGSRVHGRRLKRMSDLDLAVIGSAPLGWRQSAVLAEAFDASLLPFKVDIADWANTSEHFREIIRAEHVVLQRAHEPSNQSSSAEEQHGTSQI